MRRFLTMRSAQSRRATTCLARLLPPQSAASRGVPMPARRVTSRLSVIVLAVLLGLSASLTSAPASSAEAPTGSISGALRDADSAPVSGVSVTGYAFDENYQKWVVRFGDVTDAGGAFELADLPPGAYRVGFVEDRWPRALAPTYWGGVSTVEEATSITVGPSGQVDDIDLIASPASTLSGTLTAPGSEGFDQESPTIYYQLYRRIVVDDVVSWLLVSDLHSAPHSYTIEGLAAGTYRMHFQTYSQRYMPQFWKGAETLETATDITVGTGQRVTGIDGQLRQSPALSGSVRGVDGTPMKGVEVEVFRLQSGGSGSYWTTFSGAVTRADGTFTVTLRPGEYKVFARHDGFTTTYWKNATTLDDATIVKHVEGTPTDLAMTLAPRGSISGRVVSVDDTPLDQIHATLYTEVTDGDDDQWEEVRTQTSNANGAWSFEGVSPGRYVVGFSDPRGTYASEYFDDTPYFALAEELVVSSGSIVSGIDAELAVGGSVAGTVSGPGSLEREAVGVTAYQRADVGDGLEWMPVDTAEVTAQGQYLIDGLGPGDYRIEFFDHSGTAAAEYWDDADDIDDADDVEVVEGRTREGVDASLVELLPMENTVRPSVQGSPTPGSTITASPGSWRQGATMFFYDWLADGKPIDDAHGSAYVPTVADVGRRLSVRVYAYAAGHRVGESTSTTVMVTPAAPTGVSAIRRSATSLDLAWAPSAGASSYRVTLQTSRRRWSITTGSNASASVSGLDPATVHVAGVEALHPSGATSPTASLSISTLGVAAPARVKATRRTAKSVTLTWVRSEGATRYRVSYRSGSGRKKVVAVGNRSSVTVKKLEGKKAYAFTVEALSADGKSRKAAKPVKTRTK